MKDTNDYGTNLTDVLKKILLSDPFVYLAYSAYKMIKKMLKGKRFAILGERASGKTVLHQFLSSGKLPSDYIQTTQAKVKGGYVIKLDDLELKVEEGIDIGGSEDFRDRWESIISEADVVCYIIRTDKVFENDREYIAKVERHVDHILGVINRTKPNLKLFLINSHCDKSRMYYSNTDTFVKEAQSRLIKINRPNTVMFYGSLANQTEAGKLVGQIISKIING